MQADLLQRHGSIEVPRYTSYPTAPHFHSGVNADTYRGWLKALREGSKLSLYIHIPFCDRLCWFCACHTKQTHSYEPVHAYLGSLQREIGIVAELVRGRTQVSAIHLGGGSPTLISADDMRQLGADLHLAFNVLPDAEISVEIDPNDMDEARFDALAELGMTRASLGVQDFDPKVQRAINRKQSFDQTRLVVEGVRARGVGSVNIDMLYGLPYQTTESMIASTDQVLSLAPDRIALFGYAHVPWFKKHQTMIDEATLPGPAARFAQSDAAAHRIAGAGYVPIGLDHFARPHDRLAKALADGSLKRNFQGYTVDEADALIGLGASSVGRLPQGYVQNMAATGVYRTMVDGGHLPVIRGIEFCEEDRVRGWVIERLMCDFGFSRHELVNRFGKASRPILIDAEALAASDHDGIFIGDENGFRVTPPGRPFVRAIAANFDAYLSSGIARHSMAV